MDESLIRREFRLVTDPEDIFKRSNAFCVDELGRIIGVNASERRLADLSGIAALNKLQYLDLSLNEIEDANQLCTLTSLVAVDLAFNKITDVDFARELLQLDFLDLRNNRIKDISPAFSTHRLPLLMEYAFQRHGIFLDGNPLDAALADALRKGPASVAEYLGSLPDAGVTSSRAAAPALPAPLLAETAADTVPEPGAGRVHAADRLGTAADADMLVSVLLARDTSPPLAVGLFGEWGSGKSFFMALMQERVDELAALRRADRPDAEPFCGEVRQVRFNAWHFVDTNLWASLAATLFDGLASSNRQDDAAVLLSDLDRARETAVKTREDREELERDVQKLEERVDSLAETARSASTVALNVVRDDNDLRHKLRKAALRDTATDEQTEEVVDALGNVRGFADTAATLVRLLRDELLYRRRWATIIVLVVIILLSVFTSSWSVIGRAAAVLGTLALMLTPAVRGAVWVLLLARQARTARQLPLVERRKQLAAARAAEEKTNQAVTQQERELEELRDKGTRLRQFVRDRALSSDYTQELGVISKMRRDLEELVSLLPATEDTGRPQQLAVAASIANRVPEVERIILYIDDLDRCPEDKVVEVLQAIHLLLAFKLFVVVVGVDSRWLRQSLQSHYKGLLDQPDDYLEKIFQIPFTVRSMTAAVYRSLIGELTTRRSTTVSHGDRTPVGRASGVHSVESGSLVVETDGRYLPLSTTSESAAVADNLNDTHLLRPEGLVISEVESALLGQLGELIPNPRAAKRLVNIYRMLRVSVPADEVAAFVPDGGREYQAVVLLLGILIGLPEAATELFNMIDQAEEQSEIWDVTALIPSAAARLEHLRDHIEITALAPYRRWSTRVARFSFRTVTCHSPLRHVTESG